MILLISNRRFILHPSIALRLSVKALIHEEHEDTFLATDCFDYSVMLKTEVYPKGYVLCSLFYVLLRLQIMGGHGFFTTAGGLNFAGIARDQLVKQGFFAGRG